MSRTQPPTTMAATGTIPAASAAPVLSAHGIRVVRDGLLILDGIDLEVTAGEVVLIRGASGTGKSTLLNVMAGILPHTQDAEVWGQICHAGEPVTASPPARRSRWMGMLTQDPAVGLCMQMVRDELALSLELREWDPADIGARVTDIAATTGITPLLDRRVGDLSGGEQQRVALAAALAGRPQLLLLDEPLSMLDPRSAVAVSRIIARAASDGVALIVVEHRIDDLRRSGLVVDTELNLGSGPPPAARPVPESHPGRIVLNAHLEGVRRSPDGPTVVPDLELCLHAGTITALVGPNGSGKTTVLRALAGLPPDPVAGSGKVGLVFQRASDQFLTTSVEAEVSYRADRHSGRAMLTRLGLADLEPRNPHTLSLGQQRRVALIAAAAQGHQIIGLDEPTLGLDSSASGDVSDLLVDLRDQGRAIVMSTHDQELASRLADNIIDLSPHDRVPTTSRPGPLRRVTPDCPLGRCSPSLKLAIALVTSLALLATTAIVPIAAIALIVLCLVPLLCHVRPAHVSRLYLPALGFALGVIVINSVTRPGTPLISEPVTVTVQGLVMGLGLAARTLAIGAIALAFVLSTGGPQFVASLEQQAHIPTRYCFGLLAGYRLLETLGQEWDTIRDAQQVRSRGAGRLARGRIVLVSVFCLFVVALRRGQQLSDALELRGLGSGRRTFWHRLRYTRRDLVLVVVSAALSLLTVLACQILP